MLNKLEQAIAAIKAGERRKGQQLLAEVLRAEPNNDTALVWLAGIMASAKARREYLERALEINPNNKMAQRGLASLEQKPTSPSPPLLPQPRPQPRPIISLPPQPPPGSSGNYHDSRITWLLVANGILLLFIVIAGGCIGSVWWFNQGGVTGPVLATATPLPPPPTPSATAVVFNLTLPTPSTSLTTPTFPPPVLPTSTFIPPQPTSTPTVAALPPTVTTAPTMIPSPSPAPPPVFKSDDATTIQTNVTESNLASLLSPADVAAEVGTSFFGGGYSYPNYSNQRCDYRDTAAGSTNRPRLYGEYSGLLQLANFQPNESIRLFVYESTSNSGELVGWQPYQVDQFGQLTIQLTGLTPGQDYIFVILGNRSGEVINASGYATCGSIQEVGEVVAQGQTRVIIEDTEGTIIEERAVAPGTRLSVLGSRWEDVDNLWWYVYLADGNEGRVHDRQVLRVLGEASPPPAETIDEPEPPSSEPPLTTGVSPEQAVRDYFALIEQRQYDLTWSRLTDHFKELHNCCTTDGQYDYAGYVEWWDSVSQIQINQSQVIEETETEAVLLVDITYFRSSQSPYHDANYRIQLIWEPMSQQWLFYDTQ